MIHNKKVLAIIPARGGSKGVPRKNIRLLNGKPLIAWTIEEAQKSKYIDSLVLSSDDEEIMKVAKEYGCAVPFKRPQELAKDETPGIDPVLHAINELPRFDYIVLLQPTSPLRTVEDIDGCIEKCINHNAVVTIVEAEQNPYWMYTLNDEQQMQSFIPMKDTPVRRQDLPKVYGLNGAVYVAKVRWLLETKSFITKETIGYVMPRERSFDIDEELDFLVCEFLLKNNK